MKISLFQQAPYRFLPPDFERHHSSVCDTPYSLATPEGVYRSVRDFMDELMAGARAGFDGLAVTEHGQTSWDLMPNPDLAAAALAYATEAENLNVAIYPMGRSLGKSREPLRVAEEYALLDVLSGGRLVAGFPVGLSYDVSVNNGIAPIQTRPRFEENLDLVLAAWTRAEPFPWNGRFSRHPQVNIWPRPLQRGRPPVWITGVGNPNTMRTALERGFGFNYFGFYGTKLTGDRIFDRFWEIADELGMPANPYRLGFLQTIAVAETDAQAEKDYAEHRSLPGSIDIRGLEAIFRDPADFGFAAKMQTATYRELVEAGAVIAGSAETVREQLLDFFSRNRIGNLNAMLGFGSLPHELALKNVALFADEVLPHLRELWQHSGFEHHWWPERLGGAPLGELGASTGATEKAAA